MARGRRRRSAPAPAPCRASDRSSAGRLHERRRATRSNGTSSSCAPPRPARLTGHPKRSVSRRPSHSCTQPKARRWAPTWCCLCSPVRGPRSSEPSPGLMSTSTATRTPHHQGPRTSWSGGPSVRRRHQDPEVAPHLGPASPLRQRITCAPNPPGSGATPRRRRLAGQRPRLRLRSRHTPGRGERATRLPTVESPSSRSHGSSGTDVVTHSVTQPTQATTNGLAGSSQSV